MLIANPIYDSAFKFLMDDPRAAKVVIGTILGCEVTELSLVTRERSAQLPAFSTSVFRMDFSAVIRTETGALMNVLIELQKARDPGEVRRFRRYLAENYFAGPADDGIVMRETPPEPPRPVLPIITIYILGYALEGLEGHSAITVRRTYRDSVTNEAIEQRVDFIECLTHDCHVIQISELKQRRRNKLEKLLALFEQVGLQQNVHLKEIAEELGEDLQCVIERLHKATLDRLTRDSMDLEDELMEEWRKKLAEYEDQLGRARNEVEEERRQKEEALAEIARLKRQLGKD